MKKINKNFQKKIIYFTSLIALFFGVSDFTILPELISNVLKTELGITLFVLLGIFFVLNDLYLFLIILVIVSYKNTVLIEGAGEADDGLADEEAAEAKRKAAETKKKAKEEAKKEMAALQGDAAKEVGIDPESVKLNDGGEINSFGDLFGQARRNAIRLLNALGN
jgi:hypothetical protein